jgi:hypothetical protein
MAPLMFDWLHLCLISNTIAAGEKDRRDPSIPETRGDMKGIFLGNSCEKMTGCFVMDDR